MVKDQLASAGNFDCAICALNGFGFEHAPGTDRLMKFPPAIGRQSTALMAFVGFNPRVSKTNRALHHELMSDRNAFVQLESNRVSDKPYIAADGTERHYRTHARMVHAALQGTGYEGQAFEDVAVVTELFLCATEKQTAALRRAIAEGSVECPSRYCWPVLNRAAPKVVLTLGDDVFDYFSRSTTPRNGIYRLDSAGSPVLIAIPHPSRHSFSDAEIARIAASCRAAFAGLEPQQWDFRNVLDEGLPTNETQRTRNCYWSRNKGWHVAHRVSDLAWLETDEARTIAYRLYRNDQLKFTLTLNASQLRAAIGDYVDGNNWPRTGYNNPVTRLVNGVRTEIFLPRWAPYVVATEC